MENFQCIICGGAMKYLLESTDLLYKTSESKYYLYKCNNCGLEQLIPLPSNNEIKTFYPAEYYSYFLGENKGLLTIVKELSIRLVYEKDKNIITKFFVFAIEKLFCFGLPHNFRGRNYLLDVGCGNGFDVKLMNRVGWSAYGFEIGERKHEGDIYYGADIFDTDIKSLKFDCIRVWHVLEHVPEPRKFIHALKQLVADDGEIILGLPNTKSLHAWIFGRFWFARDIPRHLFNYNVRNLKMILQANDLRVTRVRYQSLNGFAGSLGHLFNAFSGRHIVIFDNPVIVAMLYPLELITNVLRLSDMISVSVSKVAKNPKAN